ncbi:nucleoside triphosphate pyrophosphohydrolase [Oribacterium sp. WCC10]|uniref:nucleoside triphosphate pyrophosphohydrolase n=1 Tax=Oribacterium sp. WCC10 TaxID=1855343 RepID=UPI0008E4CAEE|nr:nucleoside triphosphate pyrophosphohydrolase [Oribacterium sp. WCC10]SFG59230.1 Predicted house-cleaning noncanonical NTP pyrophosphatase, all-alpha NTP-PPase (MazG) superfamily [Oribacterium sp. WCC10]
MSVITYNKLVRDKIPEIIKEDNKECSVRILDNDEYLSMVDAKLDEELAEYHKDKNLEELADILEVLYAVTKARGFSLEELEACRAEKAEKRGTFEKKIFLENVREGDK